MVKVPKIESDIVDIELSQILTLPASRRNNNDESVDDFTFTIIPP